MKMHRIADLNVLLDYKHETLAHQAPPYEINDDCTPDITISLSDEFLETQHKANPHLSINDCEYIFTGGDFYDKIIDFGGFFLHSSTVEYKGKAYMFSAPSGTGKSTHTGMWLKAFGDEARIINDDKPAIRVFDGIAYAYGTPWSGKTDLNLNAKVPIGGICFVERAETNSIRKIPTSQAIAKILNQTLRPSHPARMGMLLDCLDKVLKYTDVYVLGCNISEEAAIVAYNGMKGDN